MATAGANTPAFLEALVVRVLVATAATNQMASSAIIKTAKGIFKRPAVKLSVLPVESSASIKENFIKVCDTDI